MKGGMAFQFRYRTRLEKIANRVDKLAHRRLVRYGSHLSVDDEIDEIEFRFGCASADGGALDGMIGTKSLIHRHAHDAPFERSEDDPVAHLVEIRGASAGGPVALQKVGQIAEAAHDLFANA